MCYFLYRRKTSFRTSIICVQTKVSSLIRMHLLDIREEIGDDAIEEFQVLHEELWHVDVADGSQGYELLIHVGVLTL